MLSIHLLALVSCLQWEPQDLQAIAKLVRAKAHLEDTAAVAAITDSVVCNRLAAAVNRAGRPVYALKVGAYYGVIPDGPGELPDELTVLDPHM